MWFLYALFSQFTLLKKKKIHVYAFLAIIKWMRWWFNFSFGNMKWRVNTVILIHGYENLTERRRMFHLFQNICFRMKKNRKEYVKLYTQNLKLCICRWPLTIKTKHLIFKIWRRPSICIGLNTSHVYFKMNVKLHTYGITFRHEK